MTETCQHFSTDIVYKNVINVVNRTILQLIGSLITFIVFCNLHYDFPILVCLHAVLTSAGIVIFVTEAIDIVVRKHFYNDRLIDSRFNLVVHGVLMTIGVVLIIVGIFIIIYEKSTTLEPIFNNMHTVTGTIATLLLIISLSVSVLMITLNMFFPLMKLLRWLELPHNICSSLGYGIGMGSLCYGFVSSTEFSTQIPHEIKLVCTIICLIITAWMMLQSFYDLYRILINIMEMYEDGFIKNIKSSSPQMGIQTDTSEHTTTFNL